MFNIIILGLQGNVGVAAYGVIANLVLVVISIYTGVAQGSQPLFSAAYGKNDKKMQKQLFKYAITAVTLISIVIYAVIYYLQIQLLLYLMAKEICSFRL